jgi:hypothetical protein
MSLEPDSAIQPGQAYKPICLGVLGKREDISRTDFHERVLNPLMELIGKVPDVIYMSNDGSTSSFVSLWADKCGVRHETVMADWRRLGRRAVVMRDARIVKEATYLLLFEQPRSEYISKIGLRELKKGKKIFGITPGKDWELQEWEASGSCEIK